MNKTDENKVDVFQNRCLRRILRICWQDRITNKEVIEMTDMENIGEDVRRRRWKFIGPIKRKGYDNDCRPATFDVSIRRVLEAG